MKDYIIEVIWNEVNQKYNVSSTLLDVDYPQSSNKICKAINNYEINIGNDLEKKTKLETGILYSLSHINQQATIIHHNIYFGLDRIKHYEACVKI